MSPKTVSLALVVAGASIAAAALFAAKPLVAVSPFLPIYFPALSRVFQPQVIGAPAVSAKPALVAPQMLPEKAKDESPAATPVPSLPVPQEQRTEPPQRQRQIVVTQPKRSAPQTAPQNSRDVVVDFLNR